MTTQNELEAFLQNMTDYDFMCGILDHLLSKSYSFIESYSPDGVVYNRKAIVLNNLGYICNDEEGIFFILGNVPVVNYAGHVNIAALDENLYEYDVEADDWDDYEDDEQLTNPFVVFRWNTIVEAVESGKRSEIYPIINHCMKVFTMLSEYFFEYMDSTMCSNFEGGDITDNTLEKAFISFVKFVNTTIIPKMEEKA